MLAKEVKKLSDFKNFLVKSSLLYPPLLCKIIWLYLKNSNFHEFLKVNIAAISASQEQFEALAS